LAGIFLVKLNFNSIVSGAITAALGVGLWEVVLKPLLNKGPTV